MSIRQMSMLNIEIAGAVIIAHLMGDYLFQNHWMASKKTSSTWPCLVHATTYTLAYVLVFYSSFLWEPMALIFATHFLIDRFRLARYWIRFVNLFGTKDCREGPPKETGFLPIFVLFAVDNTWHLLIQWLILSFYL